MRNGLTYVAIVTTLIFFSCKKDKSFDPNNPGGGGGGSTTTVLTKTVTKLQGGDSLRVLYSYDNQKKFISYISEESDQGNVYHSELKFIRNAQGIVQKMVIKADDLAAAGIDSIYYVVHYNTSSARYTSSVLTFDDGTDIFRDSTVYTYNSSGKISQTEEFYDEGTGAYVKVSKTEFTYNAAGNVTRQKVFYFDDVTNTYLPYYQDDYEYDSKVNPLILGNEAFLLGDASLASPNNQIKDTYTDFEDATMNDLLTTVYTYNSINKPNTDTITIQSEGVPYPTTYTYK
jgi:hypothetical protein